MSDTPIKGFSDCVHCNYCKTDLTNDRYKAHLGTKKHKRNVREARKVVRDVGYATVQPATIDPNLTPEQVLELSDYKGKKLAFYRQKNKKDDNRITESIYANSFLAYCAVDSALNPTVESYSITVNDKKIPSCFSDAVLELRYTALPEKPSFSSISLIYFKNVDSHLNRVDSFTEGEFGIQTLLHKVEKFQDSGLFAPDYPEDEIKLKFSVITTSKPGENLQNETAINFCAVCHKSETAHSKPCSDSWEPITVKLRALRKHPLIILNTSEYNENVYKLWYIPLSSRLQFPQVYLYTAQKQLRDLPHGIEDLLRSRLGCTQLDLISYITRWAEGRYGPYKLTKEDVLVKLAELLLQPYRYPVHPSKTATTFTPEQTDKWVRAIKSHDLTVLDRENDLFDLLQPWHTLIQSKLKGLDTTSWCYNTSRNSLIDRICKMDSWKFVWRYLLEVVPDDKTSCVNIPIADVYKVMWKAGLMPMVLKPSSDQLPGMVKMLESLKKFGLTRRYFVITSQVKRLRSLTQNLKVFANLGDLSAETYVKLHIQIGNGLLDYARDINATDPRFKYSLTATEFFYMSLDKFYLKRYPIKCMGEELDEDYSKVVLEEAVIARIKNELKGLYGEDSGEEMEKKLRGIDPGLFG